MELGTYEWIAGQLLFNSFEYLGHTDGASFKWKGQKFPVHTHVSYTPIENLSHSSIMEGAEILLEGLRAIISEAYSSGVNSIASQVQPQFKMEMDFDRGCPILKMRFRCVFLGVHYQDAIGDDVIKQWEIPNRVDV